MDQSDPVVVREEDDRFLSAPDRCEEVEVGRESKHDRSLDETVVVLSAKVVSLSAHAVIQSAKVVVQVDADRRETNLDRYKEDNARFQRNKVVYLSARDVFTSASFRRSKSNNRSLEERGISHDDDEVRSQVPGDSQFAQARSRPHHDGSARDDGNGPTCPSAAEAFDIYVHGRHLVRVSDRRFLRVRRMASRSCWRLALLSLAGCGSSAVAASDASTPDVGPDSPSDSPVVDAGNPGITCTQGGMLLGGPGNDGCAQSICGWPQPQSSTFVCSSTLRCNVGLELCSVTGTGCGTGDAGDGFSCSSLPSTCAPDATPSGCGCLGPLGNGCACTADGVGNLTVTCCPQDAGAVDAPGPDANGD